MTKNSQEVPVCQRHKDKDLDGLKCACGSYLDIKNGKFGIFFTCMNCGIVNMKKALEINEGNLLKEEKTFQNAEVSSEKKEQDKTEHKQRSISKDEIKKEITVMPDDPRFFD